jgi:NAD(P)-dependent dehydrogenase (short-subunit alcohol dehydrogenase family)
LSRSLRAEAVVDGLRVSAICPGAVNTPFLSGGAHGRIVMPVGRDAAARAALLQSFVEKRARLLRPMDPAWLVPRALDQVARNRGLIVIPFSWRLMWYMDRAAPTLSLALLQRAMRLMERQLERAAA